MARPSRGGFAKREKERARFEKRQQKIARRQNKGEAGAVSVDGDEGTTDPNAGEEPPAEAPSQGDGEESR